MRSAAASGSLVCDGGARAPARPAGGARPWRHRHGLDPTLSGGPAMTPIASTRFAAAYTLDWLAGDPHNLPHPVRLIGSAISAGERAIRRPGTPRAQLARGAALVTAIVGGSWITARVAIGRRRWAEVLLGWTALATRSLLEESAKVLDSIAAEDLPLARKRLSMIVGRDTGTLAETEVLRAVIETLAEGLCDGVVAPIFYLTVGGVPCAIAYKAVNTLDSVIGHREAPYLYFGRAAAN